MKTNQSQKNTKWIEKELGEVATFFNGKAHENDISDNGKYVVINSKFVSTNGSVAKYTDTCLSPLKKGDVAMVMSDVPNGKAIAKCFLVKENNKYTLNQRIGGFRSSEINGSFLYFLLNRNKYFLAFDDGVNQTNLRKDDILECPLYYPSLPEQNRIVSVLETWDRSIEKLSKKIEIKKQIKKGLMQDLLTGKKQLTGFKDKWETVELGDVSEISRGNSITKKDITHGDVPVIAGGQQPAYYHNKSNRSGKTITISGSGAYAGYVDFYDFPIFVSDGMSIKETKLNIDFIYHFLKMNQEYVYSFQTGGAQPHVYPKDLQKLKLQIPLDKKEQIAIANILITADKEITELEKKLSILKEQKRYLLNNLITGTIRTPETLSTKLTK
jgi:type I restriction enzyme S subunit